jgi:hypothetical protein
MKRIVPLLMVSSVALSGTCALGKVYPPITLTLDQAYYYQANGAADPGKNQVCEGYLLESNLLPSTLNANIALDGAQRRVWLGWATARSNAPALFMLAPHGGPGHLAFETLSTQDGRRIFGVQVARVTFIVNTGNNAASQPYIGHVIISPPGDHGTGFSCMLTNATEQPSSIDTDATNRADHTGSRQ